MDFIKSVLVSIVSLYLRSDVIGAATCCVQKSIILKVVECTRSVNYAHRGIIMYRVKLIGSDQITIPRDVEVEH